ncbi:hypothetical protein F0562_027226 [Nyssa sinensis]|uniref:F-box associated domain-containing protein n=1 Tax=Nyssa sinensis TaxID=561372 RepID=A0A5J5B4R7_9ASTE|nr:hypothetical protein F0562_027226 [Nyssa sinensis]
MKGKLYGTWNQYMMVHHVERDDFKLVTLPDVKSTNRVLQHHKILWESEEHIFCCQLDSDGFHIWSCIDDDDNGDEELKWQFKQSFMLKELESQEIIGLVEEERKKIRLTRYGIRLLGFNYELQRLTYILLSLDSDGFHIWSCIDDNDIDKVDDTGSVHCELKWQFKQSFRLKELELQSAEMVGLEEEEREQIRWTLDFIRLLGFNYELQMLYLELPHLILSYSFETRKLAKVWSYDYAFTILPFLFNRVCYLPSWDGCCDHEN